MNAEELHTKIRAEASDYKFPKGLWDLIPENSEYYDEAHRIKEHVGNTSYGYLACMVRHLSKNKPISVVELGGDTGVGTLALAQELKGNGKVYSCDIREGSWEYIKDKGKRIVTDLNSSLDVDWGIDLSKIGLWYIDSNHCRYHVQKEIDRYSPYWNKGTVLMFDDVFHYKTTWKKLDYDKYYTRDGLRGNGWGVVCV